MTFIINSLSFVAILLGVICIVIAAIGIFRLPDFYTRLHAAGVADTLGVGLILVGLMLQSGWDTSLSKLFVLLVFILISGPTVSYALAHAATKDKLSSKIPNADHQDSNLVDSNQKNSQHQTSADDIATDKTKGDQLSNH